MVEVTGKMVPLKMGPMSESTMSVVTSHDTRVGTSSVGQRMASSSGHAAFSWLSEELSRAMSSSLSAVIPVWEAPSEGLQVPSSGRVDPLFNKLLIL